MTNPLFAMWNKHTAACGVAPAITNRSGDQYYGYFQNRFGEQWVFVYDPERKVGELRGGDIGWDTVALVTDGHVEVLLGKAETVWLQACWQAATFAG
jgi:hypothetical protein